MAELLKGVSRDSMSHNEKGRFKDMCLKLSGNPSDPSGLDYVGCEMGQRKLEVKEDWSRASVHTTDSETEEFQIQGSIKEVESIEMTMLGDSREDDSVAKTIKVEGDDGEVRFTNHDAQPEGGRVSSNR